MSFIVQGTWLRLKTWIMQRTFFKGVHNLSRKLGHEHSLQTELSQKGIMGER